MLNIIGKTIRRDSRHWNQRKRRHLRLGRCSSALALQVEIISAKIGLCNSLKLEEERDRIRINFDPIDEATADRFFHVWETIPDHVGGDRDEMPGYLQLLALLSADIFKHIGVSVAVYEVHAGGREDATNMWDDATVACGFNTIGLDHVSQLGTSIRDIAWHKAGIMKSGCRAFSVPQLLEAYEQLEVEAATLGCPLTLVEPCPPSFVASLPSSAQLLLPEQRRNLALAIELCNAYLGQRHNRTTLSHGDVVEAVRIYEWPGRFHLIEIPSSGAGKPRNNRWYLDSAHNEMSVPVAIDWFASEVRRSDAEADKVRGEKDDHGVVSPDVPPSRRRRTSIFGHQSLHRDTAACIGAAVRHCHQLDFEFDRVILAGHLHSVTGSIMFGRRLAMETAKLWEGMCGSPRVAISASV